MVGHDNIKRNLTYTDIKYRMRLIPESITGYGNIFLDVQSMSRNEASQEVW